MKPFIFILLAVGSGGYFVWSLYKRLRLVRSGRPADRSDRPRERWRYFAAQVLKQEKIRNMPLFGGFHLLLSWGFLVLLAGSLAMLSAGLWQVETPFLARNPAALFMRDTAIALVIAGVLGCLIRRSLRKPEWLSGNAVAYVILLLVFVIVASELLFYVFSALETGRDPEKSAWLTAAAVKFFRSWRIGGAPGLGEFFWWLHFLPIFAFGVIIPNSKHLHFVLAPFNTYWHTLEPRGVLLPADFYPDGSVTAEPEPDKPEQGNSAQDKPEQDKPEWETGDGLVCGAGKLEDFTWKQLLDVFSCVKCGRCNYRCPARLSEEETKPKRLNGRLRKHLEKGTGKTTVEMFKPEVIWGCTTCGGCETACPVSCEPISKYIDMRRYVVSARKDIPGKITQVFAGCEQKRTPWGLEREQSIGARWLKEEKLPAFQENSRAEYLYYLGCAAYYEESALRTAVAFSKILNKAGVSYAVFGAEELCCGETVRRMGNERLFQQMALENMKLWTKWGVKKIITACPHCFNTIQNEYRQLGGVYEVIPHTVFLARLLAEGKLSVRIPAQQTTAVVFHDSCYLGRHNGIYTQPRTVVQTVPGIRLLEPARTKEHSFCCGAGGGRFWLKEEFPNAITPNRVRELLSVGTQAICTSCPYCKITLEAELKVLAAQRESGGTENKDMEGKGMEGKGMESKGMEEECMEVKVMDIAEVVAAGL